MNPISRRHFVGTLGAAAGLGCLPYTPVLASSAVQADRAVHLGGDGVGLRPRDYAALLSRLSQSKDIAEDTYLIGGEVEQFERHWAQVLGKETAVFMPSGTLANQLALRALAGTKKRVIVPEMSHIYNDTGDACQTLSALTLMPLAPGRATFSKGDVEGVLSRTASGRVAADVGAIAIESPIRRLSGQMFDWAEMKAISAFARDKGIGLHLDGARLFIASAYTGISPAEYAAQFDTVYVSLWKCFNAGIGAILAGPRRVLDGMFHVRRMFGGNLAVGWNAALVARHYMDGFEARLKTAVTTSEAVYSALATHPRVAVERIPNGTNLTRVTLKGVNLSDVARKLADRGVALTLPVTLPAAPTNASLVFAVNETWARMSAAELIRAFEESLR